MVWDYEAIDFLNKTAINFIMNELLSSIIQFIVLFFVVATKKHNHNTLCLYTGSAAQACVDRQNVVRTVTRRQSHPPWLQCVEPRGLEGNTAHGLLNTQRCIL